MPRKTVFACLLLITAANLITFLPSIKNNFTNLDDDVMVIGNERIQSFSRQNIKYFFSSTYYGLYHPLVFLSYSLDYKLFKLNPKGYHITNLLLHAISSLLVFWMFLVFTGGNMPVSLIVSALFAVHPLHVEPVCWISARKDVLYAPFFLISMIFYIYNFKKGKMSYYYLSFIAFTFSLLSKPMAVSLPLLFILYEYSELKSFRKISILNKIPFMIFSLVFTAVTIRAQFPEGAERLNHSRNFIHGLLNSDFAVLFYIIKTVIPAKLSCIYPAPEQMGGFFKALHAVSPFIVITLLVYTFLQLNKRSYLFFGFGFYLIAVLPVLQVKSVGLSLVADRYAYIPSLGLFYIFAESFISLMGSKKGLKAPFLLVISCMIILCMSLSIKQSRAWNGVIPLWDNAARNYPGLALVHFNRAVGYANSGDYSGSIRDYSEAIRLKPDYPDAYNNRGNNYYNLQDYGKALEDFTSAINLKPGYVDAFYNRGMAYQKINDLENSIEDFNRSISLNPNYDRGYYGLGSSYKSKGMKDSAIKCFSKAIELNPYYVEAYNNRGNTFYEKGMFDRAIADYSRAMEINPGYALPYQNRGVIYYHMKIYDKAWQDIKTAKELGFNVDRGLYEFLLKNGGK